ncbi:MAG: (R)-mandelonitrile lyase [Pseudobdellovibrionaceae bacterium]
MELETKKAAAMQLLKIKNLPSSKAPAEHFTGEVKLAPIFNGEDPSQMSAGYVCFECSARSHWHTHPKGQLLVVTDGAGFIQEWGKPISKIQKGDIIWTPPGIKHWHGASPDSTMCHLAIQEFLNGKNVDWLEKVSDEQYRSALR